MTIHIIGAGPGDPELLTLRGRRLIESCPICIYAGSLIPETILTFAPPQARLYDSAALTLDEIIDIMADADRAGHDVARLHSGDPSVYGAIAEQIHVLNARKIPWQITPGVPAYAATAARLGCELTRPGLAQTVILTRIQGAASSMPEGENLKTLAASGATLAIHLSIRRLSDIVNQLIPYYGHACPIVIAWRVSWPDEIIVHGHLNDILARSRAFKLTRTALILVGPVLESQAFLPSALYDPRCAHILRPRRSPRRSPRRKKPGS